MKAITIVSLLLVIACQIECLYLINTNYGTTDVLARILIALKRHNIEPEGLEIYESDEDEDEDNENGK